MEPRSLAVGLLSVVGMLAVASPSSACSSRPQTAEARAARWAAYSDGARTIFVGQVLALHPYSRAERRALETNKIAGISYGNRAGWADIAPVETIRGDADAVRVRYSNGGGCGVAFWNPDIGDFVLLVVGADGFPQAYDQNALGDSGLQARMQNYW